MHQFSYKMTGVSGWWTTTGKPHYEEGTIFTQHGIVSVYRRNAITMFHFVYQGVKYHRRFECCYSKRYTFTLARRLALDVAAGNFHESNTRL